MKKVLEVEAEVEKHLIAVLDAALKSAGWSVIQSVDIIRNAIKQVEEPQPAE